MNLIQTPIRIGITMCLLVGVHEETGLCTTIVLSLIAIRFELLHMMGSGRT